MSGGSAVTGKVHVLLVEDDPSVSDMYRVRLEMDGAEQSGEIVLTDDGKEHQVRVEMGTEER